jgi:hypothetical protein
MAITLQDNGQWKKPKDIYVWNGNANVWSQTKSVSIWANGYWQTMHNTAVITSNITNANLYTIMGSPTSPLTVNVMITSNVYITSVNANVASFSIGRFPAGSRIFLINQGTITGATGNAGYDGGNAISTTSELIVQNSGIISGGTAGAGANIGFYLSGQTLTSIETTGTLLGRVG